MSKQQQLNPEFGNLTSPDQIDKYYKKMRTQSRKQLLKQLYKQSNQEVKISPQRIEQDLSDAFMVLLETYDYQSSHPVVQKIMDLFQLRLTDFSSKNRIQKMDYIKEKILSTVEVVFKRWEGDIQRERVDDLGGAGGGIMSTYSQSHSQIQSRSQNRAQSQSHRGIGNSRNIGNKNGSLMKESNLPSEERGRTTSRWNAQTPNQNSINTATNQNYHSNPGMNEFQWVGVKSNFPELKPIFDEILLEKVKMFDSQLTQITKLYEGKKYDTEDLFTTARTFEMSAQKLQRSKTLNIRKTELRNKIQKKGFCNVLIRDHSQFSLNKWGKRQEEQFQQKKHHFKNNFGKDKQVPIIFQFVKKYTTTVKARDNIYKKWQERQKTGISPEELKYLCSTSLFLNRTLTKNQQGRIRRNVQSLGKELLSKLQFNIAQKIIETYRTFMKKVSDLRANYYESITQKRKKQYSINKKRQKKQQKQKISRLQTQKYVEMFRRICSGQRMTVKLNFKVYRWVQLFIKNMKWKVQQKNNSKRKANKGEVFRRLASSRVGVSPLLLHMKMKNPSTRVIKRENHSHYRNFALLNMKTAASTERFYYQKPFQKKIKDINAIKVKDQKSFRSQISGGPCDDSTRDRIKVDLVKKKIIYSSDRCLRSLILIQSFWKKEFQRKRYLVMRDQYRERMENDFQKRLASLYRIYPKGRKIDFKSIKSRLKRVSMRTLNVFKPYERVVRKPINLYTSFCKNSNLSLNELKVKNSKNSERRIGQFCRFVQKNIYSNLKQSGFVLTAKQINDDGVCSGNASPMWWAVKNGNVELCRKFLQGGGNPNACNFMEDSCLHVALQNGDIEICFFLLDYGADLNLRNFEKVTPLYYATPKMLKFLGVEDGHIGNIGSVNSGISVGGNSQSMTLKDNNGLYFKEKKVSDIYSDHLY